LVCRDIPGTEFNCAQFAKIGHCLPLQRGIVRLSSWNVLDAILCVAQHVFKRRAACLSALATGNPATSG
jgi:hypothetical protein